MTKAYFTGPPQVLRSAGGSHLQTGRGLSGQDRRWQLYKVWYSRIEYGTVVYSMVYLYSVWYICIERRPRIVWYRYGMVQAGFGLSAQSRAARSLRDRASSGEKKVSPVALYWIL